MKSTRLVRILLIVGVMLTTVGCDQISKTVVRQRIEYNESIALAGKYITLTKVENTGAFLSAGNSLPDPLKLILLSILPLLGLLYGIFYLFTKLNMNKTMLIGICLVVGGGIGNIYDRIVFGSVTDFLHIDFIIFQTGVFNVADVAIMTGMFLILIRTYAGRSDAGQQTQ